MWCELDVADWWLVGPHVVICRSLQPRIWLLSTTRMYTNIEWINIQCVPKNDPTCFYKNFVKSAPNVITFLRARASIATASISYGNWLSHLLTLWQSFLSHCKKRILSFSLWLSVCVSREGLDICDVIFEEKKKKCDEGGK